MRFIIWAEVKHMKTTAQKPGEEKWKEVDCWEALVRPVSEVVTYSLKVDCYLKGCNTNPQDTTKITTE